MAMTMELDRDRIGQVGVCRHFSRRRRRCFWRLPSTAPPERGGERLSTSCLVEDVEMAEVMLMLSFLDGSAFVWRRIEAG